jgi:hypothetical protein
MLPVNSRTIYGSSFPFPRFVQPNTLQVCVWLQGDKSYIYTSTFSEPRLEVLKVTLISKSPYHVSLSRTVYSSDISKLRGSLAFRVKYLKSSYFLERLMLKIKAIGHFETSVTLPVDTTRFTLPKSKCSLSF